jgi:menaquinone-dependent protoporphyrinogen oxidase
MARMLIAYATKEGHTAHIAEQLGEALAARGHDVRLARVGKEPLAVPAEIDAAIVGGAIHANRQLPELVAFARANRDRLAGLPTAFFTVCLSATDDTPEGAATTEGYVRQFIAETGWRPARTAVFAGKLAWTQYDFFTRLVMKLITRRKGLTDQDTARDYDYTDYAAVRRFAEEFAAAVEQRRAA